MQHHLESRDADEESLSSSKLLMDHTERCSDARTDSRKVMHAVNAAADEVRKGKMPTRSGAAGQGGIVCLGCRVFVEGDARARRGRRTTALTSLLSGTARHERKNVCKTVLEL